MNEDDFSRTMAVVFGECNDVKAHSHVVLSALRVAESLRNRSRMPEHLHLQVLGIRDMDYARAVEYLADLDERIKR